MTKQTAARKPFRRHALVAAIAAGGLVAGTARAVNVSPNGLGQVLLYPPNVAGWKEGEAWIDSNSLMLRLKLPAALLNQGALDWDGSGSGAIDNDMVPGAAVADAPLREEKNRVVRTTMDKDAYLAQLPLNAGNDDLFHLLLQVEPAKAMRNSMSGGQLWERVLEVLSSPEYQLC